MLYLTYPLGSFMLALHQGASPITESILSAPHFHDEEAAYKFVEERLWPNGPVCPHCGGYERIGKMGGKSTRIGAYKCYDCRQPLTVKIGTIFESSHIPMHIWLQAIFLISSSKKGISSHQLQRTLGITIKSAWFLSHRIREAMKDDGGLMGGNGSTIEADETFIGRKPGTKIRRGHGHKNAVFSLLERAGNVRSFHVNDVTGETLREKLAENVSYSATLMTDEARQYTEIGKDFSDHQSVNHSAEEYVRGDAHTNTIEGYFRSSSAAYMACTSIAVQPTCSATLPNSISDTTIARPLVLTIPPALNAF